MAREVKQVLVINRKAGGKNLRHGKAASQVAHGATMILSNEMKREVAGSYVEYTIRVPLNDPMVEWLDKSFAKICLYVDSDEELLEVLKRARASSIPNSRIGLVTDAGRTEFGGNPTRTVVAIGPWWADEIDKITKGRDNIKLF